jgi:hypothetical protein
VEDLLSTEGVEVKIIGLSEESAKSLANRISIAINTWADENGAFLFEEFSIDEIE